MHILFIEEVFYPEVGGVSMHIINLSQELSRMGVRCDLLTLRKSPDWPESETHAGINIHRVSSLLAATRFLRAHTGKYDLVHAHTSRRYATSVMMITAKLLGFPLVFTPHAYFPPYSPVNVMIKWLFDHSLGLWAIRACDCVINLTRVDREDGLARGQLQDRSEIIPNSINYGRLTDYETVQDFAAEYKIGSYLLFVGRIARVKNIDWILRSLSYSSRKHHLVIVGPDHGELKDLKSLASKLGIQDRITWILDIQFDTLVAAYKGCDAVILPSLHEGLPTVILEAMTFGKIVIASKRGGTSEIIKDLVTGFTLDLEDPGSLDSTLEKLADPELIQSITKNAREMVKKNYTWEENAVRVHDIYKNVMTQNI